MPSGGVCVERRACTLRPPTSVHALFSSAVRRPTLLRSRSHFPVYDRPWPYYQPSGIRHSQRSAGEAGWLCLPHFTKKESLCATLDGRQGRARAKCPLLLRDLDAVLQRDVDYALATGLGPDSVGTGRIPDKSGQARGLRIIVGAESFVADVHLCQAAVDLVAALVEPAADVPAVGLCC